MIKHDALCPTVMSKQRATDQALCDAAKYPAIVKNKQESEMF